jgi:Fic family protein
MERVTPGEYRNSLSMRKETFITPADKINEKLIRLIDMYEQLDEVDRRDILDFHVQFEKIFLFEDGNGRVGRLIMFKECLRHDMLPFILDDKRRKGYLNRLRERDEDPYVLTEVILEAQEQFSRQIAL